MVSTPANARKIRPSRKKKTALKAAPMPRLIIAESSVPADSPITRPAVSKIPAIERSEASPRPRTIGSASSLYSFLRRAEAAKAARRWLWIGVGSFAAMIALLWGWSLYLKMSNGAWRGGASDYALINRATKEWKDIFEAKNQGPITEQNKEELKAALNSVVTQMSTAYASTSVNTRAASTTQ